MAERKARAHTSVRRMDAKSRRTLTATEANMGRNGAYTQNHYQNVYNPTGGRKGEGAWEEGDTPFTSTRRGLLSVNGRNTKGARTNSPTPKNNDGSPVYDKNGNEKATGRHNATREQRRYDLMQALNHVEGAAARSMNGVGAGSRGFALSVG